MTRDKDSWQSGWGTRALGLCLVVGGFVLVVAFVSPSGFMLMGLGLLIAALDDG